MRAKTAEIRVRVLGMLMKTKHYNLPHNQGAVIIGRRVIAKRLRVSPTAVYNALLWLRNQNFIKIYGKRSG